MLSLIRCLVRTFVACGQVVLNTSGKFMVQVRRMSGAIRCLDRWEMMKP